MTTDPAHCCTENQTLRRRVADLDYARAFWKFLTVAALVVVSIAAATIAAQARADELSECRRLAPKYAAEVEYTLPDGSRCDLLTAEYAIEVDWAPKWKESIGQAVLYSIWTGRKPAVLLLVKKPASEKLHLLRCRLVCERLGVEMFVEAAEEEGKP